MSQQRRGFTLIELLIVIAILALLSAASLGPIVAPLREQQYAEAEAAGVGALARLVPVLVEDAHAAVSLEVAPDGKSFILPRRSGKAAAAYRLGEDGVLRRGLLGNIDLAQVRGGAPLPAYAAPIADWIHDLSVAPMADGRLRITLSASRKTNARPMRLENEIILRLGQPGGNGAHP